jgi:protein arginine N-methyltransferase 1
MAEYDFADYGAMILSAPRMAAYEAALRAAVRPGCSVLDLGAGTGILALLACRLGASHVHAVEPGEAIEVAREIAHANGFASKITFHATTSFALQLDAPVDVIVSDLRGTLPMHGRHFAAIADARRRLLAPGGTLIPRRDRLYAALVTDASYGDKYDRPWRDNEFGLDMRAVRPFAVNAWRRVKLEADALLGAPGCWAELDYARVGDTTVAGDIECRVARDGSACGIAVWFDADLAEGAFFSNAPGAPPAIYGQAFFPLAERVEVEAGETARLRLRADRLGEEQLWQWESTFMRSDGSRKAGFRQSTLDSQPFSQERLAVRSTSYVVPDSHLLVLKRRCLAWADGERTLGDIAHRLREADPARFPTEASALDFAADLFASDSHHRDGP